TLHGDRDVSRHGDDVLASGGRGGVVTGGGVMIVGSALALLSYNWLRVLGTAERSQIDQRVRQQLHAIVPLLDAFKSEQQPLELIFPRKGPLDTHAEHMYRFIEQPLAPTLGGFAIPRILFDVGDQAR